MILKNSTAAMIITGGWVNHLKQLILFVTPKSPERVNL